MTHEKAYKKLLGLLAFSQSSSQQEALELSISLIERDIPAKVLQVFPNQDLYECPRCITFLSHDGNKQTKDYHRFEFCPWCGQRVEWEEEE